MSRITTQSLFATSVHKPSWRSYAASLAVHTGLAVVAFAVIVPAAVEVERRDALRHFTLLAPALEAKPAPEVQHLVAPKLTAQSAMPPPRIFVPPPVVVPPFKAPQVVEAPEIKPVQPPEVNVELPTAPKALIHTGAFEPTTELAKAMPLRKVQVGGFGDPNGARSSDNSRPSPVTLPKVGAFDLPENTGRDGGGGRVQSGNTIRQTGFGSSGDPRRPKTNNTEAIRATAFGDATITPPPSAKKADQLGDGFTPLEILSKPRPTYTVEAREMRLEGEVSLQVVFQASGTIRVVRVLQGLGHGLDEAAQQAALRVRFKPATRGGVPVDTNATIKISFELT